MLVAQTKGTRRDHGIDKLSGCGLKLHRKDEVVNPETGPPPNGVQLRPPTPDVAINPVAKPESPDRGGPKLGKLGLCDSALILSHILSIDGVLEVVLKILDTGFHDGFTVRKPLSNPLAVQISAPAAPMTLEAAKVEMCGILTGSHLIHLASGAFDTGLTVIDQGGQSVEPARARCSRSAGPRVQSYDLRLTGFWLVPTEQSRGKCQTH